MHATPPLEVLARPRPHDRRLCATAAPALASSCGYGLLQADQTTAKKLRLATLCLLNRERARHGLRRLRSIPHLRLAAHWHAADMVTSRYFAHVSLAGSAPRTASARPATWANVSRWFVGENLVWGAGPFSSSDRPGARPDAQPAAPQEHAAAQSSARWASG